ncbi:MAG: beta-galactosidase, partial [Clostridia bacterium]|nr:beta-galactosidase [Clostridia bacterium]
MHIRFKDYQPAEMLRGHLNMGGASDRGERIDVTSLYIERGGKPWMAVMGEYHFARDSRSPWRGELAKMKAGGVRVVATYMFWIYHEEIEGEFDFTGDLDVRAFIEECRAQGLEVMLRIGPWAHGECRNGGFPDWLLKKDFKLRDSNPGYMAYARIWYERVFEQVKGLFFKDGGPIIGVQFENELVDNAQHLLDLKRLALSIGYDAPIYTVTGWNSKYGARIPVDDVLPVFAAYVEAPWAESLEPQPLSPHYAFDPNRNDAAVGMDLISDRAADGWRLPYERYPYATCELGSGLQNTHHRRLVFSGMDAYAMALVKLGCGN